ncbi:MAG: gluconolactonase [Rhodospirillaceae bacterium]|nr:gluconolactonase [Rhodospirillaceae bacterium]|tara:strand:+ start:338 stop:1252 length:915 start_codon:yes stop_codon:yes gene_type:complete
MAVIANSDKLFSLVDRDVEIEKIATGFAFTEGPIWNPEDECLYFSDIPNDMRRRWSAMEGDSVVREPSGSPAFKCNGMTLDGDLNLYICEHSTSNLVRETMAGERQVLASHFEGKELNSPNDVIVKSDGAVYFSDPTYGRIPVFGEERKSELDFQGVYRISPDGELNCMADDYGQPNGLCFSPDESLIYINDTPRAHIRVYEVNTDGSLSNGQIFAENIGDGGLKGGVVDGMKCDAEGNIIVTGPEGFWVFDPEGVHLGIIQMPEHSANLNWGGANWDELYCTCSTSVYRLKMKVSGNRLSYMT